MSVLKLQENVFQLPSQGVPYEQSDIKLINGDSVKIRPMTVGDQRYLAGAGGDAYQTYYGMIDRLVVEPKLSVDDLLMDDVNAILYTIKILSFGEEYDLSFECQSCGHLNRQKLKLTELEVVNAEDIPGYDPNALEVKLGKHTLTIHAIRLKDEKAVSKQMKNLAKTNIVQNESVDRLYVRYAQLIDQIDGKPVMFFKDKMAFIDGLSIGELDELADIINAQSVGVIPRVKVECTDSGCGAENDVRVGVSAAFFRPSAKH